MQLYLIRHAQSTNNALADTTQSRVYDSPLSEIGLQQAQHLAKFLSGGHNWDLLTDVNFLHLGITYQPGYRFDHLYCSPMYRTLQTSQPVAKALNLTPEVLVDIHEDGGVFLEDENGIATGYPGRTRAEILAEFPGYIVPETVTEAGWWDCAVGRETREGCYNRAQKVAGWLMEQGGSDQTIAFVSHGTFISMLLKSLFGLPYDTHVHFYHYNTAISRLDFADNGHLYVKALNRVDHLPPGLVT